MTLDETSKYREGKDLWWHYVKLNGACFHPNEKGLKKIARDLDLNISYIRHQINLYLEA